MAQKHVLRFSAIAYFFKDEEKLIAKAENAVEAGHVTGMIYDPEVMIIKGDVHASMRDKIYKVEIFLNNDKNITDAKCTCPRGLWLCHHMAALALFAHYNISITDEPCSWNVVRQKVSETKKINDLYPKKKIFQATSRKVTPDDVNELLKDLSVFEGAVGFSWLLKKEPEEENLPLVDIEALIYSNDYLLQPNKRNYILNKCVMSPNEIIAIKNLTVGQASNDKWLVARKNRITASNFGLVLSACKRNRYPPSLFSTLTGSYNLDGIKSIQWGKEHESAGITALEQSLHKKVNHTGFWIHECGILGASPDGLIDDDTIVEIKCPYKYREKSLYQGLQEEKNYIILFNENGDITVNKKHTYYDQIQGTLFITNRRLCQLVIWTPSEIVIQEVEKDDDWAGNIEILKKFYLDQYIPHLIGREM